MHLAKDILKGKKMSPGELKKEAREELAEGSPTKYKSAMDYIRSNKFQDFHRNRKEKKKEMAKKMKKETKREYIKRHGDDLLKYETN